MANTYSIGRLFITSTTQSQGAPLVDRGYTHEHDGAKRSGRGFVIRAPFAKHRPARALVVGMWRKPPSGPGVGPE